MIKIPLLYKMNDSERIQIKHVVESIVRRKKFNLHTIYINNSKIIFAVNSKKHLIAFLNLHDGYTIELRNNKLRDIANYDHNIKAIIGSKNKAESLRYDHMLPDDSTRILIYRNKIRAIYSGKLKRLSYFDAKGNIKNIV